MTYVQENIVTFYTKLDEFRRIEKYVDITIICEETSFQCHRVALASACPYFDAMFSIQLLEKNAKSVVLPEMTAVTFEKVLQFIYTGDTIINSDNIYSLIVASDFLNLQRLEDLCIRYMQEGLPFKSILDVLSFAFAANKQSLIDTIVDHVIKYFTLFLKSKEFLEISFQFLHRILTDSKCIGESGLLSFGDVILENVIIRWIKHSLEERLCHLSQLMKLCHFEDASLFESKLSSADTYVKPTRTREEINYESLILKDENVLNVFVHLEDTKEIKIFEVCKEDEDFDFNFATCKVSQPVPNFLVRRYVAINNSYFYCLDHNLEDEVEFSVSTTVEMNSKKILKNPPRISTLSSKICEMQDNVLLYLAGRSNNSMYSYNRELNEWFPIPQMKRKRMEACVTACNTTKLLYAIGGHNKHNCIATNSVQAYDYRVGEWHNFTQTIFPRKYSACCSYKGKIYLSGGMDTNSCEVFDPVAGQWQEFESMITKARQHQMTPYKDSLCAVSGYVDCYNNKNINLYDLKSNKWCSLSIPQQKVRNNQFQVLGAVVFKTRSVTKP